jgi:hypothetical protein
MGTCAYCGQPAGLMRSRHKACVEKRAIASEKIPAFFAQYLTSNMPASRFHVLARDIARTHYVSEVEFRKLAVQGMSQLVDAALADHMLAAEEEKRVVELRNELSLTNDDFGASAHKLVKAAILRDLDEGRLPQRLELDGFVSINLGRGEQIIWLFQGVRYLTTRTKSRYVGGSHGVSFRIMKGIYYRVGAHAGERIDTPFLSDEGTGNLFVTDRALYFVSPTKTTKVPASKIASIKPYSDGVEVMRDTPTAKPQIFMVDDPWFAVNLITRLNQIE